MKGFVKACLIAVLVFVVAGIVLLTVAAAGGVTRASLRLFSEEGRLGYGPLHVHVGDGFGVDFIFEDEEIVVYPDADDSGYKPGYVVDESGTIAIYQNGQYELVRNDFTSIEVDAKAGDFTICESPDELFYVEADSSIIDLDVENDCLSIRRDVDKKISFSFFMQEPDVKIFIPEGYQLEDIMIEVGAGDLDIDMILYADNVSLITGAGDMSVNSAVEAGQINMEVGAGMMHVDNAMNADSIFIDVGAGDLDAQGCLFAREKMDVRVGAGDVSLDQIDCQGILKTDCGAGQMEIDGIVSGDITAQVDAGDMELDLLNSGKNYKYRLDVGAGEIQVNNNSYSQLSSVILLEGDADAPLADLSCGAGDLEISIR